MMNETRFNEIIDFIIKTIETKESCYCICNAVNYLGIMNVITLDEWRFIMTDTLQPIFRDLASQGYSFDVKGNYSSDGYYRFQNKEQRIQFLNQLKQ
jgi:hypothetical protein